MTRIISVCLIDDETALNEIYLSVLCDHYLVKTYSSAMLALADLENGYQPDVIVSDLSMPECSGFQLLEGLANQRIRAPVILVSGALKMPDLTNLNFHNVFAFMPKPFDLICLKSEIDLAIEKIAI